MVVCNMLVRVRVLALYAFALAFVSFGSISANAAAVPIFDSGTLIGASGVLVGGTNYDVSFEDGTCIDLFGPCTSASNGFAFHDQSSAIDAANALFNQIYSGSIATPPVTRGCGSAADCYIYIPYGFLSSVYVTSEYLRVFTGGHDVNGPQYPYPNQDFGSSAALTYAVFTPAATAETPLPGALLLFASGLAGLTAFGRRFARG